MTRCLAQKSHRIRKSDCLIAIIFCQIIAAPPKLSPEVAIFHQSSQALLLFLLLVHLTKTPKMYQKLTAHICIQD